MQVKGIVRYPFKALSGEGMTHVTFDPGHGVSGDRRFAFGLNVSKDNGQWHSTRNFLINLLHDGLLTYQVASTPHRWSLTSATGAKLVVDPSDLLAANRDLQAFLKPVVNSEDRPCLIDRQAGTGPKGFWDFRDTELLIINLATLRDLEKTWGMTIDPRRFRANIYIDGLQAWSEFGLFGAELAIGTAKVRVLRPARRCAALSVNPATGVRDVPLHTKLVQSYGHGFFGIYAKISSRGDVAVGDAVQPLTTAPLTPEGMTSEGAPDIALWPKPVVVQVDGDTEEIVVSQVGAAPLTPPVATGRMKLHLGANQTLTCEIIKSSETSVRLKVSDPSQGLDVFTKQSPSMDRVALVTGPFGGRNSGG